MGNPPRLIGTGIKIFPGSEIDPSCIIGHGSCIGYPVQGKSESAKIGPDCSIGCFCVVHAGATLQRGVRLDHYCRVGTGTVIGEFTYLLYGARVHDNVRIGKRCRISGNCSDRVIIEDYVTHFGRLAHSYREPLADWDTTDEPSQYIESYAVIGANALIVGPVRIGRNSYVAAGEVVRSDVPPNSVVYRGKVYSAKEWRGRLHEFNFFEKKERR